MNKIIDEIAIKMLSTTDGVFDISDEALIEQIGMLEDINAIGRAGRTLLIHAALYRRIDVANYLLENGADMLIKDKNGFTALHAAVTAKSYEIAKNLLEYGAPVNIKDNFGNVPLMRASHFSLDIITLLLDCGADCMMENNFGVSAYSAFQAYPDIIKLMDKYIKKGGNH